MITKSIIYNDNEVYYLQNCQTFDYYQQNNLKGSTF